MIDYILALISTVISFNAEYNATHLLPLSMALFMAFIFMVLMPFMMYVMRETPEQTIERVTPIVGIYDNALALAARQHAAGNYAQARYEARVAELHAMRQPFLDELAVAQAAVAAKGAKQ
ncbi:hypothetical protein NL64_06260 [Pseudomonas fluorescens]|uniref:hypothetical protein n=1 Tax=Pseudomonas fluorescens TaxID=294 RepID=UPI00054B6148|nr:hypothetical protein [Pseudomonas fluorescens]KII34862.1 hypothetical protein NL64_06260 [Pseudomonas fluorescens]